MTVLNADFGRPGCLPRNCGLPSFRGPAGFSSDKFRTERGLDEELLRRAAKEELVLLTRDKGFGAIVSLIERDHEGVILLRVEPGTVNAVHEELRKFLQAHGGEPMRNRFIVIEPGRHRVRTTK